MTAPHGGGGSEGPSARWSFFGNSQLSQLTDGWTHGRVAYVVEARPELGIETDQAMVLDLHAGQCRSAELVDAEDAEDAEFVIFAEFERWREVLSGDVDPTKAMMQNKLKLRKGHLPTIVKYVLASKELVGSASVIDTEYPD